MAFYCSESDVAGRLGLDAGQRTRASKRLQSVIRRATVEIDLVFKDYGRTAPSREIAETTLNGAVSAGATTITLTSGAAFSSAGNGNIDGDSFAWTGKSTNDLTGVSGLSADHSTLTTVQEGEFAHVLREVAADISAALYMEDESAFQDAVSPRASNLRVRSEDTLHKTARLGTVD